MISLLITLIGFMLLKIIKNHEKEAFYMKKMKTRKIVIITGIAVLLAAAGITYWFFRPVGAVSGQAPDEAYRSGRPAYYRKEIFYPWDRGKLTELPEIIDEGMGFDLRSYDVSEIPLTDCSQELSYVTFDSATIWPEELPEGFVPEQIMENGKNPGLGIRSLHKMGLTGKGVSIAIIDQALNLDHTEYCDNIMGYELLNSLDDSAAMHGSAVASIAVGKNCGVAPDVNVYYISSTFGNFTPWGGLKLDLRYMAKGIDRILEINRILPEEQKIRVISISRGFNATTPGGIKVRAAIERARKEGIFVITPSPDQNYGFGLMGLGREPDADPDDISSYVPGLFWKDYFYKGGISFASKKTLLVPMDARTYASCSSADGYEFTASGGSSWAVPWLAGLYALCIEKNPSLTPEGFIGAALETGITRTVEYDGKLYELGVIIDPAALIERIE